MHASACPACLFGDFKGTHGVFLCMCSCPDWNCAVSWQVVTAVDPFGYYAEGIQQGLDDAFKTRLTAASPYGYHTPPEGSPSVGPRPVSAPRPSIRSSVDIQPLIDRPVSAPPVSEAAVEESGVHFIFCSWCPDKPSHPKHAWQSLSITVLEFQSLCITAYSVT